MKRLDLYILKEMAVPFLIGTLAVVMMFQANFLIYLFKELNLRDVPPLAIVQMVVLKTPGFLNMTLPVGMALASSLAISRLSRESELTAMRASGMPVLRVVFPVVVFGLLTAVANFLIVDRLIPPAERHAKNLTSRVGMLALAPQFKSNVVLTLQNYTAMFGSVTSGKDNMIFLADILLIERRGKQTRLITSPNGSYHQGAWVLNKPYIRLMEGEQMISVASEKEMLIQEKINVPDFFLPPAPEEQSASQVLAAIKQMKKTKGDTTALEINYHSKFSVPAACVVFALTGPLFAIWLSRSGPFVGVLLSIVLVLLYYNAFVISTEILGRGQMMMPILAAWLPNLLFLSIGFIALRKTE